jgi:exonuclease III
LSLNRAGSFRRLKEELKRYNTGIAALQEIRWKGSEIMYSKDYTIFYSGNTNNTFGTGFVVRQDLKGVAWDFNQSMKECGH